MQILATSLSNNSSSKSIVIINGKKNLFFFFIFPIKEHWTLNTVRIRWSTILPLELYSTEWKLSADEIRWGKKMEWRRTKHFPQELNTRDISSKTSHDIDRSDISSTASHEGNWVARYLAERLLIDVYPSWSKVSNSKNFVP